MIKYIALASALFAFAGCAGAYDPATDDVTDGVEIGQATEALSVPVRFGFRVGTTGEPCSFPNVSNDRCLIPTDKIVKPHWSGATTDSNMPGVDFLAEMRNALVELNSVFGWTIVEGSSSTNEVVRINNGLGLDTGGHMLPGNFSSTQCFIQSDGSHCTQKFNSCTVEINPSSLNFNGFNVASLSDRQRYVRAVIMHEIGHCAGLPHTVLDSCGTPGSFLQAVECHSPLPVSTLSANQLTAMSGYVP